MDTLLQQILNGLTLGSTYALLALGIAMVFSILHLVNFAHGELIALCAYAMYGLRSLGTPWIVWVIGGVATAVVAALAMERLAFRPIRHASPVSMMVASLGLLILISFALEAFVSPRARGLPQPDWMNRVFMVGGIQVGLKYVLIIVVTALALIGTLLLLRRTIIGTAMRAAAEDFDAVRLMGVKANRVIASSFALSGFLAGIAAVLILSIRGTVTPHMGFALVLNGFIANVIGGLGNLWGAVLGGFILGFVETIFRAFLPPSMSGFTNGLLFVIVAVILVFRPQGLIAPKSAARV
ncbi:MAG TPA: branched-chain amino acid ABC transporter permease [Thermoleophilia bacterium]|nr:branched-chain amino acid ABC transporter permease [Thermoleophilia bacterium]